MLNIVCVKMLFYREMTVKLSIWMSDLVTGIMNFTTQSPLGRLVMLSGLSS